VNPQLVSSDPDFASTFDHHARQYFIRCAEHSLKFAPLPAFKDAIVALQSFDESPDAGGREWLVEVYERLIADKYIYDRDNEYTSTDQYYRALLHVLEIVIQGAEIISRADTFLFTEAAFCAAQALGLDASKIQREEDDYQNAAWAEGDSK
jgi:hypothetical protein